MTGISRSSLPTSASCRAAATLIVVCVLAGATGCGQTGPLYLPGETDPRQPADQAQPGTDAAGDRSGDDSDDESDNTGA